MRFVECCKYGDIWRHYFDIYSYVRKRLVHYVVRFFSIPLGKIRNYDKSDITDNKNVVHVLDWKRSFAEISLMGQNNFFTRISHSLCSMIICNLNPSAPIETEFKTLRFISNCFMLTPAPYSHPFPSISIPLHTNKLISGTHKPTPTPTSDPIPTLSHMFTPTSKWSSADMAVVPQLLERADVLERGILFRDIAYILWLQHVRYKRVGIPKHSAV